MSSRDPIAAFIHCMQCAKSKPRHIAQKDWARLEVGMTETGHMQVWCLRHDRHVYTSPRPVQDTVPACAMCEAGVPHSKH